jgi:16S rRNA (guanine527-N7)-methyltransferase
VSRAGGVEELLERWNLPAGLLEPLQALVRIVATDERAPTVIRSPTRIIDDHIADSLAALELPAVSRARLIADLGSGAGFPGIPLALALPDAGVSLVESNARKCAYLLAAIAEAGARNATVVNRRVEVWPDGLRAHDLVTARALAPLPVVVEYGAPLLRVGGALVVWRGQRDPEAERDAEAAASELGLQVAERVQVLPYSGAKHRFLHVFFKETETPARFPRRPGVAAKRPLGAARRRSA